MSGSGIGKLSSHFISVPLLRRLYFADGLRRSQFFLFLIEFVAQKETVCEIWNGWILPEMVKNGEFLALKIIRIWFQDWISIRWLCQKRQHGIYFSLSICESAETSAICWCVRYFLFISFSTLFFARFSGGFVISNPVQNHWPLIKSLILANRAVTYQRFTHINIANHPPLPLPSRHRPQPASSHKMWAKKFPIFKYHFIYGQKLIACEWLWILNQPCGGRE